MDETKDKSSLPLLMGITGCVIAVAGGGWLYLGSESDAPVVNTIMEQPSVEAETTSVDPIDDKTTPVDTAPVESMLDADVRKARLAAEADILVFPESESALHYYGRALDADPDNAVVRAELDAVLARVEVAVQQQLGAEDYASAHAIASAVAAYSPDHSLVAETQTTLDTLTNSLVDQALDHARAGRDRAASEALASAAELPGRNTGYLESVQSSITEIRQSRLQAERDRQARAKLADDAARSAWVGAVRGAMNDGNLIDPAGASAIDILAEENSWTAERATLTEELRLAVEGNIAPMMEAGDLEAAERYLEAAFTFGDSESLTDLQAQIETAYLDAESRRVVSLSSLTRLSGAGPRYPQLALRRNITGWVEVYFTVTPTGETTDIEVRNAEPANVFDTAAIRAVEKWTFEPVEFRGQLIPKRAAARLVFDVQ